MSLWSIAQATDGQFLSARYNYEANTEAIYQSRSALLPDVSFQVEQKETDQTINSTDNEVFDAGSAGYSATSMGFKVTQSVYDHARWQRYSQSKISVDKAEVEFSLARQALMLRLAESYFLVLERGDQLATILDEKAAMQQHLNLAKAKYDSGLGRRVDMEDAQARFMNAVAKEVELQSRLADSQYGLREVIGSIPRSLQSLQPNFPLESPAPNSKQTWIDMADERSLEIRILALELEVAGEEIDVKRGGHFPTLDLVVNAMNSDTDGSVYGGGSDLDTADIALQLNFPLYSGGRVSSEVRQAVKQRYSVLEQLNNKRRVVERATHDSFNRIHTAIVQIDALEQSVRAQERLLDDRQGGYRAGKNSLLNVLDAQNDLSRARQALTKARYDYVLGTLKLKFNVGDLREGDLEQVNGWLASAGMLPGESAEES